MSQNDYSTQAGNFITATQGSVDPRTGLFSFSMPFASLTGNNNLGPSVNLSLSYNPLANENSMGLGIGCTFGLSYYDYANRKLYLNTGEQYSITDGPDTPPEVKQKKLKNFEFKKIDRNGTEIYQIIYKSGEIQELKNVGANQYVPVTIYSPAGRMLVLSWTYNGRMQLNTISDESTLLCQLTYDNVVRAQVFPGTSQAYRVTCQYQGGYLTQVQNDALLMDDGSPATWQLSYYDSLLTKVIMPTGLRQEVMYNQGVMKFPDSAQLPALPAVVSYTEYPGFGQPVMKTTYDYNLYPGRNYLGGSNSAITSWPKDKDALMNTLYYPPGHNYSYLYGSTETQWGANDESLSITTRTFNNLHLMVEQVVQQQSCRQLTTIEYPLTIAENVEGQESRYQIPVLQRVVWEDRSMPADRNTRTEETISETDDAGNPLRQVDPDGTVTLYEYYPAAGDSDNCPPEPNGFVRFVKSETVIPAPSEYEDTPVQRTNYTYSKMNLPSGRPVLYAVLQKQKKQYSDSILLMTQTTGYNEDSSSADFGRMRTISRTVHDVTSQNDYTTSVAFQFSVSGEALTQKATITSWDSQYSVNIERTQSRLNGLLWSQTDRQKNVTTYRYDLLGRILETVTNPDTQFTSRVATSYFLSANSISTQQQDSKGNIQIRYFDGKGRVLREARNTPGVTTLASSGKAVSEFTYLLNEYDYLDRLLTTRSMDNVNNGSVSVEATPFYDDWSQNDRVQYSTQLIEIQRVNPVSLQGVARLASSKATAPEQGEKRATLNLQQLPVLVQNIDASGNIISEASNEYDGFGLLRRATDEQGNTTTYTYDVWGREKTRTLPDGTVVSRTYAPFTGKALPSTISVTTPDNTTWVLGRREYDSLGRLIRNECGGRVQLLSYTGSAPVADKITTPAGDVLDVRTIPELGNALSELRLDSGDLLQSREYDDTTGNLVYATDSSKGNQEKYLRYSAEGLITGQTFTPQNSTKRTTQYGYSVMGKPLWSIDVTGAKQTYQYDGFGRLVQIDDPAVLVSLEYDDYGRMSVQQARDKAYGVTQTTTLEYDDFGREITRCITAVINGSEQELISTSQTFLNVDSGLVATRVSSRGGVVLRDEAFTYDQRNRLVDYTCQGDELPQDHLGRSIERQTFTMDALNNITECITTFTGGEDVATFVYGNPQDPCQLTEVHHTDGADIELVYDACGRLTRDEAGRTLSYDVQGRLVSVTLPSGTTGSYGYDGTNILVSQFISDEDQRELYYRAGVLINEVRQGAEPQQSRMVKLGNACVGVNTESMPQ